MGDGLGSPARFRYQSRGDLERRWFKVQLLRRLKLGPGVHEPDSDGWVASMAAAVAARAAHSAAPTHVRRMVLSAVLADRGSVAFRVGVRCRAAAASSSARRPLHPLRLRSPRVFGVGVSGVWGADPCRPARGASSGMSSLRSVVLVPRLVAIGGQRQNGAVRALTIACLLWLVAGLGLNVVTGTIAFRHHHRCIYDYGWPASAVVFRHDHLEFRDTILAAAINLTVLLVPLLVVIGLRSKLTSHTRRAALCRRCNYDLRATAGAACPECGEAIPLNA